VPELTTLCLPKLEHDLAGARVHSGKSKTIRRWARGPLRSGISGGWRHPNAQSRYSVRSRRRSFEGGAKNAFGQRESSTEGCDRVVHRGEQPCDHAVPCVLVELRREIRRLEFAEVFISHL
jgi:hypothetical protein